MKLKGVIHLWSETGTEGGFWAFQDEKYIIPPTNDYPFGKWSYEGLYVLKTGDKLTIISPVDGSVLWEGIIDLQEHPLFTEYTDAGFWLHADQKGIAREEWAKWFYGEYPAILERL
jgi:hypothetical protein